MPQYICETCPYFSEDKSFFEDFEKVRSYLEIVTPQIEYPVGSPLLICMSCYYLLRSVGTFIDRCIDTQNDRISKKIPNGVTKNDATHLESELPQICNSVYSSHNSSHNCEPQQKKFKADCRSDKLGPGSSNSFPKRVFKEYRAELCIENGESTTNNNESQNKKNDNLIKCHKNIKVLEELGDEEYVCKQDLVAAGILSDDSTDISSESSCSSNESRRPPNKENIVTKNNNNFINIGNSHSDGANSSHFENIPSTSQASVSELAIKREFDSDLNPGGKLLKKVMYFFEKTQRKNT